MEFRVVSPGEPLTDDELSQIEDSLKKIGQRLKRVENYKDVWAEVHISKDGSTTRKVCIELRYGRNHFVAKAEHQRPLVALREARDELLRQINDSSRRTHSSLSHRR